MCDYFWQRMENDRGELADIVRAGTRSGGPSNTEFDPVAAEWQLPSAPMVFSARTESPTNNFGDSFLHLRAPLLDQYTDVEFFGGAAAVMASAKMATVSSGGGLGWGGTSSVVSPELITGELETKRPCSKIFSRVLQISPGDSKPSPLSPRMMKPSPIVAGEMMRVSSSSIADPVDHDGGVQTLSPPTLGTKRRKSQAKKVVCIPAPVAASSRPTGEVVPSDLWAWRKYGQKPIKGSPYPRGYYRCSSSKGCSARKQVERSRNDPNMLVITYTSEHNHPWPTQRNALAGSTRSQASKNASRSSSDNALKSPTDWKEENGEATNLSAHPVKEELAAEMEKAIEPAEDDEFDQIIHQTYKPMIDQADDFFADLAELEADPVSLIFSEGLMETKPDEERGDKASDPFNMFDWAGSS